jgi:hypothetical protein
MAAEQNIGYINEIGGVNIDATVQPIVDKKASPVNGGSFSYSKSVTGGSTPNVNDSTFFIPPGRTIQITKSTKTGGSSTPNIFSMLNCGGTLLYEDDFAFKAKSNYKSLIDGKGSTLLNLVAGATGLPSGQFALQGLQAWENTESIEFSISARLLMQTSGYADVLVPALSLVKAMVPTKADGALPILGQSLIPPGPNLRTLLALVGVQGSYINSFFEWTQGVSKALGLTSTDAISDLNGCLWDVRIGSYIVIPGCVIKEVEPTFSAMLDSDYCPISCDISIGFATCEVATVQMINTMLFQTGVNSGNLDAPNVVSNMQNIVSRVDK